MAGPVTPYDEAASDYTDSRDLPVPGVSKADVGLTVLELLEEYKEEYGRQRRLIEEAEVRERIVLGEQWYGRDPMVESMVTDGYDVGAGLIQENLLYPYCLTYSARVNQGRVAPKAFPFAPTQEKVIAARAVDQVLDYERHRCDENKLILNAAFLVQCHGDVYFYPTWSDRDGPHLVEQPTADDIGPVLDENGAPVTETQWEYGGTMEEVIAAPNYWTDPCDEFEHCSYVVVRRPALSPVYARRMLETAGFVDVDPPEDSTLPRRNPSDLEVRGVECFEMWSKPGARFKDGHFALVVGGYVCKSVPYEKDEQGRYLYDGELPGAVWKLGEIRGSPRGKTHVANAIHPQRLINSTLRTILRLTEMAGVAAFIGPSGIVRELRYGGRRTIANDGSRDKDPRVFQGPEVAASLFNVYMNARRSLGDVFGINEATTTGGDPTQTESGKQLETASALDAQKLATPRANLERARWRVDKHKVSLARAKWGTPRLVRVLEPDGAVNAAFIKGADLEGADVVLETSSGILNSRIGGMRRAEERAAGGLISPEAGGEMSQTGLSSTIGDQQSIARVDAQGLSALRGQPQQPLPDVDPKAAADHLRAVLHSSAGAQGNRGALVQLIAAYEAMAQQAPAQPDNGTGRMPQGAVKPTDSSQAELSRQEQK